MKLRVRTDLLLYIETETLEYIVCLVKYIC